MDLFATLILAVIGAVFVAIVGRKLGVYVTIAEYQVGVLYSRGKYIQQLSAGRYWLWRIFLQQTLVMVDTRLQTLVIGTQEIPTRDQVTIKVSAVIQYRVTDPVAALHKVDNYSTFIYQEVQLALRAALSSQTLDELFAGKDTISESITNTIKPRGSECGLEIQKVGVKDVTLPADIRAILSKSLDAERSARSALIAAREELATARCQANTAKVLRDNPIIMKLKELNAIQEVAKKPGNTIIFSSGSDVAELIRGAAGNSQISTPSDGK